MSPADRRRSRWLIPVGAATVVLGASATFAVAASADTPAPSAEELLTAVAQPEASALSGTVLTRGDLGLPAVPAGIADVGPFSLNDDEVTAQVWVDGDDKARITVGAGPEEVSVIRDGDQAWLWSAADNRATVVRGEGQEPTKELPGTPAEMAAEILAEVQPTSEVTVVDGDQVAGRDVFDLVVTPKDDQTLVAQVVIAVDVATSVPLQVEVYSTELSTPAYQSGFTSVEFAAPDSAVFQFVPPAGAEVTERQMEPKTEKPDADVEIVGDGWSAVAVGRIDTQKLLSGAGDRQGSATDPELQKAAAEAFTTFMTLPQLSGEWGTGRVVAGTLFSVVITDDGQYAVGAVGPEALAAALSEAGAQ